MSVKTRVCSWLERIESRVIGKDKKLAFKVWTHVHWVSPERFGFKLNTPVELKGLNCVSVHVSVFGVYGAVLVFFRKNHKVEFK